MHCRTARALRYAFQAVLLWTVVGSAAAQNETVLPLTSDKPYTLHVYENLVQVPSIVLNPLHGSMTGLQPQDFNLRLDSGPVFHPLHIRLQGDDQMSVAVLIDNSGGVGINLLQKLDAYADQISPTVFLPDDTLRVATSNCRHFLVATMAQASMRKLQTGISSLLLNPAATAQDCKTHMPVWDVVANLAMRLTHAPGRRVIVVISNGTDEGSRNTWEEVRQYANWYSIAVVGLRLDPLHLSPEWQVGPVGLDRHEDPFSMLSSGTGGILLSADLDTIWPQFDRLMHLLRERYILDFQRPVDSTAGLHQIDLAVKDKKAIVRISGVGVPLPNKDLMTDPSTVPGDMSHAPVFGDRKILTKAK